MKVKELIEELKTHDPELDILIMTDSDVATYLYYEFDLCHIHVVNLGPKDSICDGFDIYKDYLVFE
jgi:hypothetical protein